MKDLYLSDEWCEVWFFPPFDDRSGNARNGNRKGVEGWRGTQRIMFVGLNPSTGRFPSRADRFLYRQLRLKGFRRAHLGDVIKERAEGRKVDNIEGDEVRMQRYRGYLIEEIKIVRLRLIVAMGGRAHAILTCWLHSDPRLKRLCHYAARFPTSATRCKFAADLATIRDDYRRARIPR